ncbi:MAG: ABC transporter substrate-binding protein [Clostridia bacterium]|nr:ABC transporter substrate-binding protein [Clostridia bacterium]
MKKSVTLLLCLSLILCSFLLTSCGAKGKTLAEIKEAGVMVVATSPDFPPFEYLSDSQTVEGIEIDILNAVCQKLGVKLEIAQMDFNAVLPGIKAGKYDVGASGITVNAKRQKNALFTSPYCMAAQVIVVKEDSPIASKADLTGKTVSVQTGTTAETFCQGAGYTVDAFEQNPDAEAALTSGRVDAWVIDDLTAKDMVAEYNASHTDKLTILAEPMTKEPYAFAFTFGSEDLVAEINTILADMQAKGEIKAIFTAYDAPFTAPEN